MGRAACCRPWMGEQVKHIDEAREVAQTKANDMARANPTYAKRGGCDFGLERYPSGEYHVFLLPLPRNRFGHELACEVVMPEINRFEVES